MRPTLATAAILALASSAVLASPRDLVAFNGSIHSDEYKAWHFRWHQGGAFLFHEEMHPCHVPHVSCVFTDAQTLRTDVFKVNTTIVETMGFVELQYDLGDDDVRDGDFIGVYCVDTDEEPSKDTDSGDFFDYVAMNATQEGSYKGSVVVGPLVNMRCSYQFRYLRHVYGAEYHAISESAHIEMERGHTEPVQIHLALTGVPGEMRVTWTSGISSHQHVHYWPQSGGDRHHTEATTTTYAASDMCSQPATTQAARWFRHPGYIHEGVMVNLTAGTTYQYNVGSKTGLISPSLSFTYPAMAGARPAATSSQSFFVFGDLGQGVLEELAKGEARERHYTAVDFKSRPSATSPKTVINRIAQDLHEDKTHAYAAVVHIGDLSYAKGRTFVWDQFGALIEPVASKIPYMVGVGNHEYDYTEGGHGHDLSGSAIGDANGWHPATGNYKNDSKGECGVPAVKRFTMPANGNHLFWYSFKLGLSHHVVISSEHNCSVHSPMHKWLAHELSHNVNRTETPWLFVHLHRPLYCSENFKSDNDVSLLLRRCLEPLLMKHRVDIVFSGHYHAYERTCPVYKDECRTRSHGEPKAPIHIMVGSGGAELDDIDYIQEATSTGTPWSVSRHQEYGYGRLHVHNTSHAHFEFVRSRDHHVADDVWIVSKHHWSG